MLLSFNYFYKLRKQLILCQIYYTMLDILYNLFLLKLILNVIIIKMLSNKQKDFIAAAKASLFKTIEILATEDARLINYKDDEVIIVLIFYDFFFISQNGATALHYASRNNDQRMIRFLIFKGANQSLKDKV